MRYFKYLFFGSILLSLTFCKSAKGTSEDTTLVRMDSVKNVAKKIYLHKNKKLEVGDLNGSITYALVDDDKTSVIRFSYEKDMDKVAFDGGYREEVVFEFPNDIAEQSYADAELKKTKMLFGRYCFCRGFTGLYTVNQGNLHVTTSKKETHFELQFRVNEVPQVTTEVKF